MLASDPVPTLNQKKADLGIPRDSLKPHPALDIEFERKPGLARLWRCQHDFPHSISKADCHGQAVVVQT
jgi:hypothetical protein